MEQALVTEIENAIILYEQAIGGFAARTRQMLEREGAINALSRLIVSPDLQQGFKVLRDRNQLDSTFEAVIVKYPQCFSKNVIEAACWRLNNADHLL